MKLGSITKIRTGKLDANAASDDGQYPFFTCSQDILRISTYSYDCECVLVAGNGDLNVKYYNGKFDAYQRTYIIENNFDSNLSMRYLYYFLKSYVHTLRRQSIGGVIKYIKLENLTEADLPLPNISIQNEIVEKLDRVSELIIKRNQQLAKLDTLVKSRFIEMFGDIKKPIYPTSTLGDECILKSGTTLPANVESEEGAVPYIKVSDMNLPQNVTYIKISTKYVSREDAGKTFIKKGAVIFPKRGAAIATNKKRILTHDTCCDLNIMGVLPQEKLRTTYLYNFFSNMDLSSLYNGSTVPQINNKDIAPLKIGIPPMEAQLEFEKFFQQVNKSKSVLQKLLEKQELLRAALMQEYFG